MNKQSSYQYIVDNVLYIEWAPYILINMLFSL